MLARRGGLGYCEDNMNIQEIQDSTTKLGEFTKQGEFLIGCLKKYIKGNLPSLKTESASPCQLSASFFGLRLRLRVELRFRKGRPEGSVAAYALSYEKEPKEIPLVNYQFTKTGHDEWEIWDSKKERSACDPSEIEAVTPNFSQRFWSHVFEQLATQADIPAIRPERRQELEGPDLPPKKSRVFDLSGD